jgi:DNA polymerase (family 10)
MANPNAAQVAELLNELAQRMELSGGNPYRARAYSRAAENLALTTVPLKQLVDEGQLQEIPGIGDALAAVITEIYETGHYARLDAMRGEAPAGLLEMLRIPGLKPDRVRKLHTDLRIGSVAELEKAARSGQLESVKGFGPAFQAKVLQGIEMSKRPQGRHLHRAATAIAYASNQISRLHPDWENLTPAGDFRRGSELVGSLSLVVVDPALRGPNKSMTESGELTVHVTSRKRYGVTLLLATGSDAHIANLQALAKRKGCSLSEEGLRKGPRILAGETEEDIYDALGLPFIPPELRESGREVQLAATGQLPELVRLENIRGILHAHTDQSDGSDTLKEMADATRKRGYTYLGLTDHSQTAHYAGGLKAEEVIKQQAAIDKLNKSLGRDFHVFKGIESDILGDGSLDFPEDILRRFDLIVASVHSKFKMSRKEQTDRIVKAVENPHTTVLGHVTGRQLLKRPGYEVDMERILRACAKNGVAIEINAHPWRLDMDWRWCERGLELGCMFSINPDAHSTDEIDNLQWGVLMARKGAVPKERVLNALTLPHFRRHLEARKLRRKTAGSK